MYSVSYYDKQGNFHEEYLDILNNESDKKRFAYLLSLEHFNHITNLYSFLLD